jgi:hypothetical protein
MPRLAASHGYPANVIAYPGRFRLTRFSHRAQEKSPPPLKGRIGAQYPSDQYAW